MQTDYSAILKRSWAEIPKPKLLPEGSWRLKVRTASFKPPAEEGKNPHVMIVYEPKEPMQDVPEEALDDLGEEYPLHENRIFHRHWLETGADYDRLRELIIQHEVDLGANLEESLKTLKGGEIVGFVKVRQFVGRNGPAEENVISAFTKVE